MHIFLTGKSQIGKTTIIRHFLTQTGLSADGFMTYWESVCDKGRNLYLSPYDKEQRATEKHFIVQDNGGILLESELTKMVFDEQGSAILNASGKHDIIVMDELGFFESQANVFQNAVIQRLSGNTPILGVIKPIQTEFLDIIRAHHNVMVREVTTDNRDAILTWLLQHG